jgi:hypothetical protein
LKRAAGSRTRRRPRRVSVVLTDEEYARMTQMARARERSMSWLGRYAVRRLLDEYEGGQLPLQLDIPER